MGKKQSIKLADYLDKYSLNTISSKEKEELRSYIKETYKDEELDNFMRNHWAALDVVGTEKEDRHLRQLQVQILNRIIEEPPRLKVNLFRQKYWSKIAAVLFFPLLICALYMFFLLGNRKGFEKQSVTQQIFATPGSRVHFVLPDSSNVWLNSGSSIEFAAAFNSQQQRRVKLTGQGYFEVTHDKNRPFFVETTDLQIKVLGTSFDVSSYNNDRFINSTLEQGAIVLMDLKGKEVARLVPGEKASLDKQTHRLHILRVNTQLSTSWKDGILIFKQTPLKEVTKQLERWFNCSIHISEELLDSDISYTATIKDETLGEVLKMIEISTSVKTQIKNREVTIMKEDD